MSVQTLKEGLAKRQTLLLASLLFVFSLIIYAGSLNNGFVWDDEGAFVDSPETRDLRNIPSFFLKPYDIGIKPVDDTLVSKIDLVYYRPLVAILHTVEYQFFGSRPLGYKVVNLLLNGMVVLLGFLLVKALTADSRVAFVAALLYAANPARAEAVYWVYSDTYLLSALFCTASLLCYHHRRFLLALTTMAIALLCQESSILLFGVIVCYELLISGNADRTLRACILRVAPFLLLVLLYLGVRKLAVGVPEISPLAIPEMLRAVGYLCVKHVKIFFLTDAPVTMYLYVPGMFGADGVVGLSTYLMFGAIVAGGVFLCFYRKSWLFWYVWFFMWIALFFNVGRFNDYYMAEKAIYLASLGPCVLLALFVTARGRLGSAGVFALIVLLTVHSFMTIKRDDYWTDTRTYLEKLLEFEPAYAVAQLQLGLELARALQYQQAIDRYEKVLVLRPDISRYVSTLMAETYGNWAQALAERGDLAGALAKLDQSLRIQPGRSATHNSLGIVHYLLGNLTKAGEHWSTALRLDPRNAEARSNLERFGLKSGDVP